MKIRDEVALFTEACERFGFELKVYDNSIVALENFRAEVYDIAIVDILMPVMNGLELSQKLMDVDKLIAIIYLTSTNLGNEEIIKENPNLQWVVTRPILSKNLLLNFLVQSQKKYASLLNYDGVYIH